MEHIQDEIKENLNSSVLSELKNFEMSQLDWETKKKHDDTIVGEIENTEPKNRNTKKRDNVGSSAIDKSSSIVDAKTVDMSAISGFGESLDPDDTFISTLSRKDIVIILVEQNLKLKIRLI